METQYTKLINNMYRRRRRKPDQRHRNFFNKFIKENFLNLNKEVPIKVQKTPKTPNIQGKKRNTPEPITNVQRKYRVLKATREITGKDRPSKITCDFSIDIPKARRGPINHKST